MKIIHGITHLSHYHKPVVAIGVFDGMHVGHTAIITRCVRKARAMCGTSVVVTFWPHPQKQESIYSIEHRCAILRSLGVEVCILIGFTRAFKRMRADDFIAKVIAQKIGATYVMVGKNFVFGRHGKGDVALLRRFGARYGYTTIVFPLRTIAGHPISSTRIREDISEGRLAEARRLLGRRVSLLGTVIAGNRLGRRLGYPTANIKAAHEVVPPDGIYAVTALIRGREIPGICYKGTRPTFGDSAVTSIEVHLFAAVGNLYGAQMEVCFFKRIRGDKKFAGAAALQAAITRDIAAAKKILSSRWNRLQNMRSCL